MMATVTTPTGERLEGVTGSLLDYYRGEANTVPGYVIDDGETVLTDTPRLVEGDVVTPLTDDVATDDTDDDIDEVATGEDADDVASEDTSGDGSLELDAEPSDATAD